MRILAEETERKLSSSLNANITLSSIRMTQMHSKIEVNIASEKPPSMNFLSLNIQGLAQKAKKDWAKELCVKNKVNFLAIQETKMEEIDLFSVQSAVGARLWNLWGTSMRVRVKSDRTDAASRVGPMIMVRSSLPTSVPPLGFISGALMISSLQLGFLPFCRLNGIA
ncbi:RNA-directed DNA polymerase, eukaryota [Tanacetum coccineum]|uniref:RNA-directed DNA polymerase, eukaryota n=1 Tax=Tanacetum coccineum TaxID=301880 RepID=A0ABQ5IN05_9ASTR